MAEEDAIIRFSTHPAEDVAQRLAEAILAKEGLVRLAVAGGSVTPVLGMARKGLEPGLWRHLRLTWVDERCVPFDHPDSNRGTAYRGGHLDSADPCGLELPLYLDGETPGEACARVRVAFVEEFQSGLDLVLLGLGEDGHIASLFPGRASLDPVAFAIADSPKPPAARITLALPVISGAPIALMLATGKPKLDALKRLQLKDPALPASGLRNLLAFTDLPDFAR